MSRHHVEAGAEADADPMAADADADASPDVEAGTDREPVTEGA